MNEFSEDNLVEKTGVKIFEELWGADCHINAFGDEGESLLGRDNQGQVVLTTRLQEALKRLNPNSSPQTLKLAEDQITRDRHTLGLVNANQEVWKLLRDGARVEVQNDRGELDTEVVKIIDFNDSKNNDFLLVSQLWVTGELHKRRPDLVGFVNGIPLVLIELKALHKNLRNACNDNLRDYKDTIPQLFWYNAFTIISNGIESKMGTLTSAYEHFNEWKKVESEDEPSSVNLETILRGTCDKQRLLDIVENFTLFDASRGKLIKAVSRYFQYYGVNKAIEQVKRKEEIDGKLGVFWHTQGSGKSYSMVFFSQKVLRKLPGNYTFVLVTDRKELDKQIYENFSNTGAVYEEEVHADSIADLRQLLTEDHRHVFTLIHKFGTRGDEVPPVLSERDDVIIMVDEAHRTQYDRLAQNMRIALPNASFIGFTGTPLMQKGEEATRKTFGNYVSTYNFSQSIDDGATVPLYYENRIPKLDNTNKNLEEDIKRVMEFYDLSEDAEQKLEQEFSSFYHLITREERLNTVAEDIVYHFTNRGYHGKGMVVSIDTTTAVRLYSKVKEQMERYIKKLYMDKERETDDHKREEIQAIIDEYEDIDMAVVVSQRQNEIDDLRGFDIDMKPLRERMIKENLEDKFKDPKDNLRLVFVCAMWITGFDAPSVSTLYLDKPLQNHTLMQTIARANRVYPGKHHGLIVDYIGVFRNLQKALAVYAIPENTDGDIVDEKSELISLLRGKLAEARSFLSSEGLDIDDILEAADQEKLNEIDRFTNRLLHNDETKRQFKIIASNLHSLYKSILPDEQAEQFYREVMAFKVVSSRIREVIEDDIDVSPVKRDLERLLDRSIATGEISKIPNITDLSGVDFEKLKEVFGPDKENILLEKMIGETEKKIEEMVRRNKLRQDFLARLQKLIDEYNLGTKSTAETIDAVRELIEKDITQELDRAAKENLTEEQLAIYDLLKKDSLDPKEEDQVKKTAVEMLASLKTEQLVLDWRRFQARRAAVKTTINDYVYDGLPTAYEDTECEEKAHSVYQHVYDAYVDATESVY
jgi:type I restriction enzyme R subunit